MQVTETLAEGLKREYTVIVGAEAIEGKMTEKLTELSKTAQMPGFRPGKVPVSLLRKTYGKRVLGEILETTVNESTNQALEDNNVKPALQPNIEITSFDEGKDLEYKLAVEIMPDFEPMDFSTLSLERLVCPVSDDKMNERLDMLAKQMRSFVDADDEQAAAEGDAVVMDFTGSVDGEKFDGGSAEDFQLELGSGRFIPGFEDQLIGVKKGEERSVNVTFPEDYNSEELAGKDAVFETQIKQIKVALPVAIDDALAEKVGFDDLEALKEALKADLEKDYGNFARTKLKRQLLDSLAEKHDFAVPEGMVNGEFEQIWAQITKEMEENNQSFENAEKSEEETRKEYRDIAERRVRLGLLLSEVGNRNNISVADEEVSRAIAEQARNYPGQEREVMEFFMQNAQAQAQIRAPLLEDKVIDFIVEMAEVSDKEVDFEELIRDPDENESADAKPAENEATDDGEEKKDA